MFKEIAKLFHEMFIWWSSSMYLYYIGHIYTYLTLENIFFLLHQFFFSSFLNGHPASLSSMKHDSMNLLFSNADFSTVGPAIPGLYYPLTEDQPDVEPAQPC